MCYITKWHCGSKMCYQWGICVTNVLPLDKISLTIVLKKVVYFADYKHITLPATQRNHLDPILCYHRPHADHFLRDRGSNCKGCSPFRLWGCCLHHGFRWLDLRKTKEGMPCGIPSSVFLVILSFRASCRIRTNDPEITNHVLWPTELKRQVGKLFLSHRYNQVPLLRSRPGGFLRSWS